MGGATKSIKKFDSRVLGNRDKGVVRIVLCRHFLPQITQSLNSSFLPWQVWRVNDAHSDVIRDIAWSPLITHWVASAGTHRLESKLVSEAGPEFVLLLPCRR